MALERCCMNSKQSAPSRCGLLVDGIRKVSDSLGKVLDGHRKELNALRKVLDGLR